LEQTDPLVAGQGNDMAVVNKLGQDGGWSGIGGSGLENCPWKASLCHQKQVNNECNHSCKKDDMEGCSQRLLVLFCSKRL